MTERFLKVSDAIREAIDLSLSLDPSVYLIGLGVPDPKGIFGTTQGLSEKYGSDRVLDMPISENGITGIAIGSAIAGMRPLMTHQRADFMLLALDQLINNAAKWRFMFVEKMKVPLVIRLIIGRGWGQGPQHSQSFQSFFTHIPGLNVVAPSNSYDAKGLLLEAMRGDDPVVYLEHRWLHNISGFVPEGPYQVPFGKAKILSKGKDCTIVASSYMTVEAWKSLELLRKEGIEAELVDLRSLKPLDEDTICTSVMKTGRLLVVDGDWKTSGVASEVIALVTQKCWGFLKEAPARITFPDAYVPTSWALANHYYPGAAEIAAGVFNLLGLTVPISVDHSCPLDTPDSSFKGPF